MSRDLRIRGNDYAGRSHIAPGGWRVSNVIQLAGHNPLRPVARLHGPECKKAPCINLTSMQTGNNLSPGLFASVVSGSCGEERPRTSFSSRSALKFAQLFNAMVEIAKSFTFFLICLFGGLVITGAALSPFIYLSFFRLH